MYRFAGSCAGSCAAWFPLRRIDCALMCLCCILLSSLQRSNTGVRHCCVAAYAALLLGYRLLGSLLEWWVWSVLWFDLVAGMRGALGSAWCSNPTPGCVRVAQPLAVHGWSGGSDACELAASCC